MKNKKTKMSEPDKVKIDYWREFVMTFSNSKSLFSSKKIEKFVAFYVMLIISVYYMISNIGSIKALEFVEIISVWLAYGGYNSAMNFKDKKLDADVAAAQREDDDTDPDPVVHPVVQPVQTTTTTTTTVPPVTKPDVPDGGA